MNVFIREAPIEENIASECIHTVGLKYGRKFYNYANTMRMCTDTMRTASDTPRIPVHAAYRRVDYRDEIFLHRLNSTCFRIKKEQ